MPHGAPAGLLRAKSGGLAAIRWTLWLWHAMTFKTKTYWNMTLCLLQNMRCQRVATYLSPRLWYRKPPWRLDQWQSLVVTACSVDIFCVYSNVVNPTINLPSGMVLTTHHYITHHTSPQDPPFSRWASDTVLHVLWWKDGACGMVTNPTIDRSPYNGCINPN